MLITTKEQALRNAAHKPPKPEDRLIRRIEAEIGNLSEARPYFSVSLFNQSERDAVAAVIKLYQEDGHWNVIHEEAQGRLGFGTLFFS